MSPGHDYRDWSRDELIERVRELEQQQADQQHSATTTRRGVVTALGAIGAGAVGLNAVRGVEAAPSGTFPVETDDALELLRADRVQLVPRTSDPADVADGQLWYRGDV